MLRPVPESEGETFEAKSSLDPTSPKDMLGLVADVVAMANTAGGRILIGTDGSALPENHVKLFDSARLDDKVNSYTEPNVGGISSKLLSDEFLLVAVEKSRNPPHIFKRDGNYSDSEKNQSHIFRSRDIFVRHSSKTERATRSDLDRMFSERQKTLFEKVKMVFEAPAEARIQVVEGVGVPMRIDPAAPDARPVYDVMTPNPFRDLQQELIAAVKSWKTSRQLLNETQVMKAYAEREGIKDVEVLELVLRSCWERYIPGFWWAGRLGVVDLPQVLKEGIAAGTFPSSAEALKVASVLPRAMATELFRLAEECPRKSVRHKAKRLGPILRARTRKYEKLIETLYTWQKLTYTVPSGTKIVEFGKVDVATLDEIIGTILAGKNENRGAFKTAESILFAPRVADFSFPEESEIGQTSQTS